MKKAFFENLKTVLSELFSDKDVHTFLIGAFFCLIAVIAFLTLCFSLHGPESGFDDFLSATFYGIILFCIAVPLILAFEVFEKIGIK